MKSQHHHPYAQQLLRPQPPALTPLRRSTLPPLKSLYRLNSITIPCFSPGNASTVPQKPAPQTYNPFPLFHMWLSTCKTTIRALGTLRDFAHSWNDLASQDPSEWFCLRPTIGPIPLQFDRNNCSHWFFQSTHTINHVVTRPAAVGHTVPDHDSVLGPLEDSTTIDKIGTARSSIINRYRVPLEDTLGSTVQPKNHCPFRVFDLHLSLRICSLFYEEAPPYPIFRCYYPNSESEIIAFLLFGDIFWNLP